jgi:hypothetical protein
MKLIITESKMNSVVTKWLDKNYGDLTSHIGTNKEFQHSWLSKGDKTIFDYYVNARAITISDEIIQSDLVEMFNLDQDSLNDIFIPWFDERYNLNVKKVYYTKYHCWKCNGNHITQYHIDD